jgi:endonuclease/exonuclease/phosphatase family metal-dependent hydrolase
VKSLGAVLWLLLCAAASAAALSLMSWNVENLFDDVHNGTEYREFDPGRGRWNTQLFLQRVRTLSEVVRQAVPGGPDILVLQEVENENALATLLDKGTRGMGYRWHVLVPKKGLAANVAIVSRLPIARVLTHSVGPWKGNAPVRDILEAQIETGGGTLYLFDNHWKAKTEGVKATEASRIESASVLSARIREIQAADPGADIVAAGDLNENLDEYPRTGRRSLTALMPCDDPKVAPRTEPVIYLSAAAPAPQASPLRCVLFDPWYELPPASRGSESWHGDWLTPDHILLSAGLFDGRGLRYRPGSFTAVRLPSLVDARGLPRRWVMRAGREEGVSDHLPLLLVLDAE